MMANAQPGAVRQVCTFRVGELLCGLDIHHVQEIVRFHDMTRVPHAPKTVSGLLNLRGDVVTAVELRVRLELGPRDESLLPSNVVVRTGDGVIALLVDEIGDILELSEDRSEAPPPTVDARTRALVTEVFKLDGELLLVLDHARVVNLEQESPGPRSPAANRP